MVAETGLSACVAGGGSDAVIGERSEKSRCEKEAAWGGVGEEMGRGDLLQEILDDSQKVHDSSRRVSIWLSIADNFKGTWQWDRFCTINPFLMCTWLTGNSHVIREMHSLLWRQLLPAIKKNCKNNVRGFSAHLCPIRCGKLTVFVIVTWKLTVFTWWTCSGHVMNLQCLHDKLTESMWFFFTYSDHVITFSVHMMNLQCSRDTQCSHGDLTVFIWWTTMNLHGQVMDLQYSRSELRWTYSIT